MAEVLSVPSPHEQGRYFSSSPLLHTSPSQSSFFLGSPPVSLSPPKATSPVHHYGGLRTSRSQPSLLRRTSSFSKKDSGISFHEYAPSNEDQLEDEVTDEFAFPSYDAVQSISRSSLEDHACEDELQVEAASTAPTPEADTPVEESEAVLNPVADDIDARQQPSRQVDYLSHEWKEEDIWSSWRHIVARRKLYGERSRLENASWRTWAKQKYGLRTVSPETLNWLKDCDVTWLYGPLQEAPRNRRNSELSSHMSKSASFLKKKPILKKRSVSEEMLQRSISSSSLVKQAAAAVQAQRSHGARTPTSRPSQRLRRCASDFDGTTTYTGSTGTAEISSTLPSSTSSGVTSPENTGVKRRIRFDNNVEQCIAVDFKEVGSEEEANPAWTQACSDDDSDDDLPTIKTRSKPRKIPSSTTSSRASFSSESKGIAKLPSTTLKFHHEEPGCQGHVASQFKPLRSPAISPSPSQETLKPATESSRFLLEDPNDQQEEWGTSTPTTFRHLRKDSLSRSRHDTSSIGRDSEETYFNQATMRRTNSGMFMPFEEGEDDNMGPNSLLGRIADTVNTAKDICYVLYNVGWRK